jgi:hypothetical protein
VAYGLIFAGALCGATLVKADLSSQFQATGVNATAYAAKLQSGEIALVILNKDAERDLELTLDFGPGRSGAVKTATLHAPALESREAHITRESKRASLKHGRCAVTVPHASGFRLTVT